MAAADSRSQTRRRLLWVSLPFLALCGAGVLALREARDRLPELLSWTVEELVPGVRLEVATARLESSERFAADGVLLSLRGSPAPFFTADRVEVGLTWRELFRGRVRAVRAVRPGVSWTSRSSGAFPASGGGGSGGIPWSVERLSASDGHLQISSGSERPDVSLDFDLDLRDVGFGTESRAVERAVAVSNVRVGSSDPPLFVSPRIEARLSLSGVDEGRLEALRVVEPRIDLSADAAVFDVDESDPSSSTRFSVGHLVVEHGRIDSPAAGSLPAITAGFDLDLTQVGNGSDLAAMPRTLELSDVRVTVPGPGSGLGPMLSIPRATAEVSVEGLLEERSIAAVRVPEGALLLDGRGRAFLSKQTGEEGSDETASWRIGTLEIGTLAVHLAELGQPIPDVTFDLHTTLTDLPLSAAAAAIADQEQKLELASFTLYSPYDPFQKVVTIGSVFVDFSIGGLTRQEIARVKLLRPTIHLSEDLFWYMTNERSDAGTAPPSPWTIALLRAELGSLVLEVGKVQRVGLPITFETEVRDVRLDNLADLKIAAELEVPQESYVLPDYDLSLDRVRGQLHFDYPPGKGSENFVSTLYADAFEWRDYQVKEGWLALTFDSEGINGTFGGSSYDGYLNGGITVPYAWNEPWVGWVSASEIDLAEFTPVAAGDAVEMTGPLDANIALTIAAGTLEQARGDLSLTEPGRLEIQRLDAARIPADWPSWQRDLAKIGLEALKNFDYDEGRGKLSYEDGLGLGTLDLRGPDGGRKLEVRYHGEVGAPFALDVRVASREDGR